MVAFVLWECRKVACPMNVPGLWIPEQQASLGKETTQYLHAQELAGIIEHAPQHTSLLVIGNDNYVYRSDHVGVGHVEIRPPVTGEATNMPRHISATFHTYKGMWEGFLRKRLEELSTKSGTGPIHWETFYGWVKNNGALGAELFVHPERATDETVVYVTGFWRER